jgi:hypothetical protein
MILIQDAVAQGDVRICILAERPNEERKIHHDWRHAPVAAIRLNVEGDPHVISMCHCQVCQRRTGSTYSVHAYFSRSCVKIGGSPKAYSRTAESGRAIGFYFCPESGSTMFWEHPLDASQIGIPVGAFADPSFPLPEVSIFMPHKHPWVVAPNGVLTYGRVTAPGCLGPGRLHRH